MSDSTERIKKFLENETNFIRYQITGFEYDRGKRILSEVTQAKPNDLTVFLPIHERWVPEKYTANARRPFHQLHYVVKGKGEITMKDLTVRIKSGDVYLGLATEDMEYRTDPADPFEIYSFAFTGLLQDEFVRRSGFDRNYRMKLSKETALKELRAFFKNDLEKFVLYLRKQETNPYSYRDYLHACQYLGLNMTIEKNRYPHNFKHWHDIRIDEYATAKAVQDEKERKAFYDTFAAVANKYSGLEYDNKSVYIAVIAQSPAELIREGELLNHCVGRMGYDQKFAREESLIFFIRTKKHPDVPFVTVEYSPSRRKILQCYAYHDSTPDDGVLQFVNLTWLPYANKKLRKLQRSAA